MQLLKIIKHSDLFSPYNSENEGETQNRKAARAVVLDNDNKVALLNVSKLYYHKLPGGGVDEGETLAQALEREIKEEIGCKIFVTGEIGKIIENRDKWNLKQESYCYLAKVIGDKGQPDFTKEELDNGFSILWVSLDEAIGILKKDATDDYEGKFIKVRDLTFLEEAKRKVGEMIEKGALEK